MNLVLDLNSIGNKSGPPKVLVSVLFLDEGPTQFFSSRVAKKGRKGSLVEGIMAIEKKHCHFKHKYK